jgi:hypothetical protein
MDTGFKLTDWYDRVQIKNTGKFLISKSFVSIFIYEGKWKLT